MSLHFGELTQTTHVSGHPMVIPTKLSEPPLYEKRATALKGKKLPRDDFTALTFSLAIEWYHQNSRVVM